MIQEARVHGVSTRSVDDVAKVMGAGGMSKSQASRLTKAQIIEMIEEKEAGMATADVCRKHRLSPAAFYELTLPVHPETEADLRRACGEVHEMRTALLEAFGKDGGAS